MFLVLGVAACSGGETDGGGGSAGSGGSGGAAGAGGFSEVQQVGPDGGILRFPNRVILDIPAGAVSETIEIRVVDVPMDEVTAILNERRLNRQAERRMVGAFRIEPDVAFDETVTATLPVEPPERGEIWRQVDIDREAGEIWPVPTELEYFADRGVVEMKLPPATQAKRLALRNGVDKQASEGAEHGAEGQKWDYGWAKEQNDLDERCKLPKQPQACEALDPLQPACCLLKEKPETCICCRVGSFFAQSSAAEASQRRGTESCEIFTDTVLVEYYDCIGPDGEPPAPEPHAMGGVSEYCPEDLQLEVEILAPSPELFVCKTQQYAARIRGALADGTEVIPWQPFDPVWESERPEVADFVKNQDSGRFDGTLEGFSEGKTRVFAMTGLPEKPYAKTGEIEVRSHIREFTLEPPALLLEVEESALIDSTLIEYDGTPLSTSSIVWTSLDPSVAERAPDVGPLTRVFAIDQGCTDIEAKYTYEECEEVVETVPVCVECPLVTLTVIPRRSDLAVDGERVLRAEATKIEDSVEVPVDVSDVRWTTSDDATVQIDRAIGPSTTARARGPGRATINAIYEDVCQLRIVAATIDVCPEIALLPDFAPVQVGDTVELQLRALDAAGDPTRADLSGATFDVSDEDKVEIALGLYQTILVKGLDPGTVTVTASFNGDCGPQQAKATVLVQDDTVTGTWNVRVVDGEQDCDIDGDVFGEPIYSNEDVELVDLAQVGESLTASYRAFPSADPYSGTIRSTSNPSQPYRFDLRVSSTQTIDCIQFFETDGEELHYGQPVCPEDTPDYQWTCQATSCTETEQVAGYFLPGREAFVAESTWQFDARGNAAYEEPPAPPVFYQDVPILCMGEAQIVGCRSGSPVLLRIAGTCVTTADAEAICIASYGEELEGAACLPGELGQNVIACLYCR